MPLITTLGEDTSRPSQIPSSFTLGDLLVGNGLDEHGVEWGITDITGWWDPPGTTSEPQQRAADDGAWIGAAYTTARTIEVTGWCRAGSWRVVSQALDRLFGALPVSRLVSFIPSVDGVEEYALVRQDGDPLVERQGNWAKWSIAMLAPDPRRYSTEVTTAQTALPSTTGGLSLPITLPLSIGATVASGLISVVNDGNMPTRPTLTVYGPVPPFAITHRGTGQTLRFHETIPAGRRLVMFADRRRALMDGTAARRVTGSWFEYTPGINEVAFTATDYDPAALLVSQHRSARR